MKTSEDLKQFSQLSHFPSYTVLAQEKPIVDKYAKAIIVFVAKGMQRKMVTLVADPTYQISKRKLIAMAKKGVRPIKNSKLYT